MQGRVLLLVPSSAYAFSMCSPQKCRCTEARCRCQLATSSFLVTHTHTKKMILCMFARSLLDVSYVTAVRWSALPSREETVSEDYVATSASSATCAVLCCAALPAECTAECEPLRNRRAGMKCWKGGTWSQAIIGSVAEPPTFWACVLFVRK